MAFETVVSLGAGRKDILSSLFSKRYLKLLLPEDNGRPLPECKCLRGGLGGDVAEQGETGRGQEGHLDFWVPSLPTPNSPDREASII